VHIKSDHYCVLSIDGAGGLPEAESLRRAVEPFNMKIKSDRISLQPQENAYSLKLYIRYKDEEEPRRVMTHLSKLDGIASLSWD
jgi:hypothetical protein